MIETEAARDPDEIGRLSPFESMYLQLDRVDWPCHFGALAILEGSTLLDAAGELRMPEIRQRLDRRLVRVPRLRQRLHRPPWFLGPPLWVDDEQFAIHHHVHAATVPAPGTEAEVLEAAARLYDGLLDRAHPLWELWFMTGLAGGRVAALLKLHHAVADGLAAVAVMRSLFDLDPLAAEPSPTDWSPRPIPGAAALFRDNASRARRAGRRILSAVVHPARLIAGARVFAQVVGRSLGQKGAPRTSLNGPVRAGRRVRAVRIERTEAKRVARAYQGTVNDVVLSIWTGGLRRLLRARGEDVEHLELVAGQAVSLRPARRAGSVKNDVGTIVLPLPAWQADPRRRLEVIRRTTRAKRARRRFPAAVVATMAAVAHTPLGSWLNHHQRAVNVIVTNVPGPAEPVYVLGARILDILPIIQLVGNIGLTLCAFSYAGQISLVVTADERGFPDLDVLVAGMAREWNELAGTSNAGLEQEAVAV